MKWLLVILSVLLLALQYRLWIAEGSWAHVARLDRSIAEQEQTNKRLRERNRQLATEVEALKQGLDSIEARAREDLGMIKEGETFYMMIEPD